MSGGREATARGHRAGEASGETGGAVRRPAVPVRRKRSTLRRMWRERSAYGFLAPGLILFSVFTVFALLFAFYLTFHEWNILEPDKPFVGLQNYRDLIHDKDSGNRSSTPPTSPAPQCR